MYEEIKLSIIIVNYNAKYFVEQCLHSVEAATRGLEKELFVVDNHSSDGSIDYLRPRFPEVQFIANQENPGFAKANNQAIRLCTGEYVLLLNPDTVVGEESLRSLCYFLDEHPEAGGLGVKMIDGHGQFLVESKRSFPSPWVSFCKLFGLSTLFPNSPLLARYALRYLPADKTHEVEVLAGAFMLMRHEALDKIGLLDEDFFMYGEDIDLSYRLVLGGYKNYYLPERLLHYKGECTKHNDMKYIRAFYGAMSIFFRKYYPRSSVWMQGLVQTAILLKQGQASLARLWPRRGSKTAHRRLLVCCSPARFESVQQAIRQQLPPMEHINLWDLDQHRLQEANCRSNLMKGFTDYLFCYPDTRFEQMLLFMDQMSNKNLPYHIYHPTSGRIVSPGK